MSSSRKGSFLFRGGADAVTVYGTIIDYDCDTRIDYDDGRIRRRRTYFPIYQFDYDGRTVEFRGSGGKNFMPRIGKVVKIKYNEYTGECEAIKDLISLLIAGVLMIGVGVLFLSMGFTI